ncbi:hypothetical protein [Streptomyces sp. NBC_00057]|uniref:hypothetical protein n=1 Tax=Streptomyces sp. NBC_00057 TaxID=2975634 RepID=UPI00324B5AD9
MGFVEGAVAEHREQHVGSASGEAEEGLGHGAPCVNCFRLLLGAARLPREEAADGTVAYRAYRAYRAWRDGRVHRSMGEVLRGTG